jgi:hypothetical protein
MSPAGSGSSRWTVASGIAPGPSSRAVALSQSFSSCAIPVLCAYEKNANFSTPCSRSTRATSCGSVGFWSSTHGLRSANQRRIAANSRGGCKWV